GDPAEEQRVASKQLFILHPRELVVPEGCGPRRIVDDAVHRNVFRPYHSSHRKLLSHTYVIWFSRHPVCDYWCFGKIWEELTSSLVPRMKECRRCATGCIHAAWMSR